jgi:ELWxxDGT repeat protein
MLFLSRGRLSKSQSASQRKGRVSRRSSCGLLLRLEALETRVVPSGIPHLLADIQDPGEFLPINTTVFFRANDGTNGFELWRSDGTSAGTQLVKDINPGSSSSYPQSLTNVGGTLFFSASDGAHGRELWRSDGTAAGTQIVKDIRPGSVGSYPYGFINVGGTLFFDANDGTNGHELWRSDGTAAGTQIVKDINPGSSSSYPSYLTNVGSTLFFEANDGTHGQELWRSDGTAAGTQMVADINPGSIGSYPGNLTNVGGTLFFQASDGTDGREPWRSDGTAAGTQIVKDINPGSADSFPKYLTNVGGTLFFSASDGAHGRELWRSDGTAAGTQIVQDIRPGSAGSYPYGFTNVGGTLFFSANDGTNGRELWRSDGTAAGTQIVKDINPGSSSSYPSYLTNVSSTLFFEANDGTHGQELWRSDGTAAGTQMVADINPGSSSSYPQSLTNARGTLFFSANDGFGTEPWTLELTVRPSITTAASPTNVALGAMSQTLADSATLSGGNNPTGTITFTLYYNGGSSPVDTETVTVSGNGTYATPAGYTLPTTGTVTGTYQWDVGYSGDSNNNSASDNNDANEQVTVSPASPAITTTPNTTSVTLGTTAPTLTDSATLSGGYYETGTITFTLYHGSILVDTETATVSGNGTYTTPAGYTLPTTGTVTGTYQWDAGYSGDGNNNGASDINNPNEQAAVSPASPAILTTASPAITLGTTAPTLSDSAVVSGGYYETGNLVFTLSGPGGFSYTQNDTLSGNGTYSASTVLPTTGTVAGTYTWSVSYAGDANNNSAVDQGGPGEHTVVSKASPSILTTASPAITLGTTAATLSDSAAVSGGYYQTGNLVFTLSGPGGFSYTQNDTLSGNGTYSASTVLPTTGTVAGTYTWSVSYAGDVNNNSALDQGGPGEQTVVSKASPSIVTTDSPAITLGTTAPTLSDSAVVSGGYYETGNLVFTLSGPGGFSYTQNDTLSGNGTYSASTVLPTTGTVAGTYTWSVSYAGDVNNNSAVDQGGPAEQTVVSKASPSIVTTASGNVTLGTTAPTLSDSAVVSGGYYETGNLVFTLSGPGGFSYTQNDTLSGNGTYSASTVLPTTGTVAGTYTWSVSSAGDANNNSAVDQGGAAEQTVVSKASPSILTTASGNVTLGTTAPTLSDSAVVSGGYYETGNLVFTLSGPGGFSYTQNDTLSGNGTYSASTVLPTTGTVAGTYTWSVSYAGDANNYSAVDQGGPGEQTVVSKASPSILTTASGNVTLGTTAPTLSDSAVVSGGYNETGNLVFTLSGPGGFSYTQNDTLSGNGTYSASTVLPTTGTVAGTYTWSVSYAGDVNNNSAVDQGGQGEQTMVSKASPSIATTASPAITLSTTAPTLSDSAVVSGGYYETGNLVFTLSGPGGFSYTQNDTLSGNGTYSASTVLPTTGTVAGTYTWSVSYAGDVNNNSAVDQGGQGEQTMVSKASPSIATTASPAITLGTTAPTLSDSAVVSGGYYETGNLVFTLSGPGGFSYTQNDTLSGNGTYSASTVLPTTGTVAGTYTWSASYAGDVNNNSAVDQGGAAEQTVVSNASPSILTTASPAITLGTTAPTLSDSAVVSGGYYETGNLAFTLSGPGGFSYTQNDTLSGNGTYSASTVLPTTGTVAGTYTWSVSYAGDVNNNSAVDQGGPGEHTLVSKASPSILTTASGNVTLGTTAPTLSDSAVVSGGYYETGNLVFTLSGPGGFSYTQNDTLSGNGTYSASTVLPTTGTVAGTYTWSVSHAGDVNNNSAVDQGGAAEQTVVSKATFTGLLVLDPTASGALSLVNNGNIHFPGVIQVDSSSATAIKVTGNAFLGATAIDVVGGYRRGVDATISPAPVTGAAYQADPLAGLAGPSTTGLTNYGSVNVRDGARTISPGIYRQINVSRNGSLTMNPGTYIILGGGLTVSGNASITGQGVLIYNAGSNYPNTGGNFGGITLSGNGSFNLSAPASGPYSGVLIFQSRQNTRALRLSGDGLAGISGSIYAANALLSMTRDGQLQASLVVGTLNLSGNVALTQMAAGSDGSGDGRGIAGTLLAGNLFVYVDNSNGAFTPDELARIQDTISSLDVLLAPYSVTITVVNDPALASVIVDMGSSSASGTAAAGVLGCYNGAAGEITLLQGWNWYAGADPSQVGPDQYDFQTTVTHEFGHAIGLGGATNANSPMFETLAPGTSHRTMTVQDLNIPYPPEGADPLTAAGFARDTGDLHLRTAVPFFVAGILANSVTSQFNFGSLPAGAQGNGFSDSLLNPVPSVSATPTRSILSDPASLSTGDSAYWFRRVDDRSPQDSDMDSWIDAVGLGCLPTGEWRKADGTGGRGDSDGGDSSLLATPHCSPGEHLSSPLREIDEVFRHWGADGVLWDQGDVARPAADLSFAAAIALLGMVDGGCGPVREQPSPSKATRLHVRRQSPTRSPLS